MRTLYSLLVLLILCVELAAQEQIPLVEYSNPPSVSPARGYSQLAAVNFGNCTMLMISGQVALDSAGNLIGQNDMLKQTEQVFKNIERLIKAKGGTMQHLVKIQYYVTDLSQIQQIRVIRDKYVNVKTPPVSTLVQVSSLFRQDLMIEIEGTAIIPNKGL